MPNETKDRPEYNTPSAEELQVLPRLACVLFAARCAYRAYCMLEAEGLGNLEVLGAVKMAEDAAYSGDFDKKEVIRQANALVHKGYSGNTLELLAAAYALHALFDKEPAKKAAEAANAAAKIVREDADVRTDFTILVLASKNEVWTDESKMRPNILGDLIRSKHN